MSLSPTSDKPPKTPLDRFVQIPAKLIDLRDVLLPLFKVALFTQTHQTQIGLLLFFFSPQYKQQQTILIMDLESIRLRMPRQRRAYKHRD